MDYSERQERITFLLKEMLATDPITLTAALSLLPDYSTEKAFLGGSAVPEWQTPLRLSTGLSTGDVADTVDRVDIIEMKMLKAFAFLLKHLRLFLEAYEHRRGPQ